MNIFFYFMDSSAYNTFVLYCKINSLINDKRSRRLFLENLSTSLMKPQIDKRYNYILTSQIGIQKTIIMCFNLIGYNFSMDDTNPQKIIHSRKERGVNYVQVIQNFQLFVIVARYVFSKNIKKPKKHVKRVYVDSNKVLKIRFYQLAARVVVIIAYRVDKKIKKF